MSVVVVVVVIVMAISNSVGVYNSLWVCLLLGVSSGRV